MLTCEKQGSRFVFTREDGATVVFNADNTIVGIKGKTLKSRPAHMEDYAFSIALNNKLEDTIEFVNRYYSKYKINIKGSDELIGCTERLFKVIARYVYENVWHPGIEVLKHAFDTAMNLAYLFCTNQLTDGATESDLIKFIKERHIYNMYYYQLQMQFNNWYKARKFWKMLPPIEYPQTVREVCDNVVTMRDCTDAEFYALKQAITNQLIVNLEFTLNATSGRARSVSNITALIESYFNSCQALNETPNLNGNFLTKFAEAERKLEAQKNECFATQQNRRNLHFEDERLTVIVPQTIEALIEEGKKQHNCVGKFGYDKNVIRGNCNIVFIRRKSDPDTSYITCEIDEKGYIRQYLFDCNAKHNLKGSEEAEFHRKYANYLHSIW